MNHIPFSVVMSVYQGDNPCYFERALKSIIEEQSIVPDEVLLIVDGPISEELDLVINKYMHKYNLLRVIRLEKNGGLGNALRIGVENCKYELIARMDSDDISVRRRFEEQLSFFEKNEEVDIVGGDITEFVGLEENIVGKRCVPSKNLDIYEYMKKRCAMNHVTVMYKKKAVQEAGGYQDWFWNEDYYLWIRMVLNKAVFANTGTVLVNVRVGEEMYQRRGGKRYYLSEKGLQDYMLKNKMISWPLYVYNCTVRYLVQILLPNKLRGYIFRKFARS